MALFRKRRGKQVDPDERSPKFGVKYKDLMVMNQLLEHGADLTEAREVVFYSYAPSQEAARRMASEAAREGFDVEIREPLPQRPAQWSVGCRKHAVVDPMFVRGAVEFFEGLATRNGAAYDGWEAAL